MPLPALLQGKLSLPVLCSPMFLVSGPELVFAQCRNGIVGAFPALNARPQSMLHEWLVRIEGDLAAFRAANPQARVAPYAVNQIVHKSNARLDDDFAVLEQHKVPLVITSLRAPDEYVPRIHAWGGLVFHDVTTLRHAQKAIEAGVDGLILVPAGAGGHAGTLNPMALVSEVRRIWDGPIVLAGAITRGEYILAAQAMGADMAYMGTRFIATQEARAQPEYKQMIVDASASDILYTSFFSGTPGSYLKPSIAAAGLDPESLGSGEKALMDFAKLNANPNEKGPKAWRDIWSAGQGVGGIDDIPGVDELVARLKDQYAAARARLLG
jgi:nitronate monooxygenase